MPADPPDPREQKQANRDSNKTDWVQVSNYAQLAFIFPVATVVGWLIGVALDKWLHTTWLYIVGLLLGILAGFLELIRTAAKNK
jgi:F0F1-type ATP synthase assembly protein I